MLPPQRPAPLESSAHVVCRAAPVRRGRPSSGLGLLGCAAGLCVLLGCGSETSPSGAPSAGADGGGTECAPGERRGESGSCLPAGVQDNGCLAGERFEPPNDCIPAGIPPELCADGFEADDMDGCVAVLPADPCPFGLMALPGETTCREVAPCGTARWGDIPVEANTQHVDGAYVGGASDGTAGQPWTTIQDAIDAAQSGAIVAIAAGSYVEELRVIGKQVRLWGRCPALVDVRGTSWPAVAIGAGADGTEVRDMALGGSAGVSSLGSMNLLLDRLWIHDALRGVHVDPMHGPTSVTLSRSLLERYSDGGVVIFAAEATIEDCVVRDAAPGYSGTGVAAQSWGEPSVVAVRRSRIHRAWGCAIASQGSELIVEATAVHDTQPNGEGDGLGLYAWNDEQAELRPQVAVRASVFERNTGTGFLVGGADLLVEATSVRHTAATAAFQSGKGVLVQHDPGADVSSTAVFRSSVISDNVSVGVLVAGSDAIIESTIVRDTGWDRPYHGMGLALQPIPGLQRSVVVLLRSSVLERNGHAGVAINGSSLTVDGTIVRDTLPTAPEKGGRGLSFDSDHFTGEASVGLIRSSLFERNRDVAVFAASTELTMESTVVRETLPTEAGYYGRAFDIQRCSATHLPATAIVRSSILESSHDVGLFVIDAEATIEHTVVRDTSANVAFDVFGDGIAVLSSVEPSQTTTITSCRVEESARAGVANFGAQVSIEATAVQCSPMYLTGQVLLGSQYLFQDLGGNECGCDTEQAACVVLAAELEPPAAIDEPAR